MTTFRCCVRVLRRLGAALRGAMLVRMPVTSFAAWLLVAMAAVSVIATASAAAPLVDLASEPPSAACRPPPASVRAAPLVVPTAAGVRVYQASARPADWSGAFNASALRFDEAGMPQTPLPLWEAGALLNALPDVSQRRLYTLDPASGLTIPFEWAGLAPAQRAALDRSASTQAADGQGEQRLLYLRGERGQEGSVFRRRGGRLGDAVNSTPVYVGAPSAAVSGVAYDAFRARHAARRHAVYLGANDGMLHAFDALDGGELFAYVPDALMPALNRLSDPGYVHRAYVDGPASAAEAWTGDAWKTVLVSAMGGGAQGVFALDVTDPTDFARGGALWEFTDRDDAVMGYATTLPQVARLRTRVRGGVAEHRHFAVVASGINNYAADGHAAPSNAGALFLLALDKPVAERWQLNRNYYRLQTPAVDAALANALSAPALVAGSDGALRYAYAGDLQGNLWRFDLSGGAPWRNSAGARPLFLARDADGAPQPIAQQPKVVYAPDGGYLILFGTGKLLGASDRAAGAFSTQSWYAVLDEPAAPRPSAALSRADLLPRVLDSAAGDASVVVRGRRIEYGGAAEQRGWYLDFPHAAVTGERSVAGAALGDGKLFFNTVLPGRDACAALASRSYTLDALSGLALDGSGLPDTDEFSGELAVTYLPAPPALLVTGRSAGPRQPNGRRQVQRRLTAVHVGATGAAVRASAPVRSTLPAGRIGWREVANWRELHRAAQR